ncbi:MAG: UvrD-helicase domain-containing protein, partial [Intestinibacter sp.]
ADDGEETRINKDTLDLLSSGLFEYKKLYWQEGIIDHEDVLFFSYQLLKRYPFMLKILNAKYPYFFIDEFQDTNPIQVKIINMIAQEETVVGVIGDSAQSIYGFQGANCEQFESFELMNMNNYEIHGNRRSTNRIIDVLNSMRRDFKKKYIRNKEGEKPVIVIGDKIKAINKYNNEKLVTLSRKNITVNKIRKDIESTIFENDFLERFKEADSDKERRYTIMDTIFAIETAKNGNFREALKILDRISFLEKNKKNKFHYLKSLLDDYDKYSNDFLIDLYTYINDVLNVKLTTLRKNSKIRYFYENSKYKEFVICVNSINEKSDNKTIHQSKGDEFDNIMIIKEDDNLDFLTNPDLINNEEHRIYYVAMSRAKEKLFINIPYLNNPKSLKNLEDLFEFIYLE